MTDKEYAKEWPFPLTEEEIRVTRAYICDLDETSRELRKNLCHKRMVIESKLGVFDHTIIGYLKRFLTMYLFKFKNIRPR